MGKHMLFFNRRTIHTGLQPLFLSFCHSLLFQFHVLFHQGRVMSPVDHDLKHTSGFASQQFLHAFILFEELWLPKMRTKHMYVVFFHSRVQGANSKETVTCSLSDFLIHDHEQNKVPRIKCPITSNDRMGSMACNNLWDIARRLGLPVPRNFRSWVYMNKFHFFKVWKPLSMFFLAPSSAFHTFSAKRHPFSECLWHAGLANFGRAAGTYRISGDRTYHFLTLQVGLGLGDALRKYLQRTDSMAWSYIYIYINM